ncbi:alpha/beta hydrolase [Pedobacter sp. P351]|uniref:alpha/beta hydrolase n=1 Tax=Pedobacter superstes TaxID=3133441 RepID=UPI0030978AE3
MIIYFVSGLGADRRAFQRIVLPAGYEMYHIEWLPVKGNESIEFYAKCLADKIDVSKPFIIAGLSFGGMMAIEMSKIVKPDKLILFSTIRSNRELPLLYRLAGLMRLYKLLPDKFLTQTLSFLYWFFGPLDIEGKRLVSSFLQQSDPLMLTWAFSKISRWRNKETSSLSIQIHGSKDRVFPVRLTKPEYIIEGAGHLCVFTHANEINAILLKELK